MRKKMIEVLEDTRANAAWHHWGYEESADHLIANDVVLVVRCKDCKHRDEYGTCTPPIISGYGYDHLSPEDNDFCSYGERKDNERKAD